MARKSTEQISIIQKAYKLLTKRERRALLVLMGVISVAGLGAAGMVASIFPFLSVLSDPGQIERVATLSWVYQTFGFETQYDFLVAMAVMSLVAVVIANCLQVLRAFMVARFTADISRRIGQRLFDRYIRQDYSHFLTRNSNEIRTQILGESVQVVNQFLKPVAEIVSAVISVSAISAVVIWINPVVALSAFALLGGCYGVIYLAIRMRLTKLGRERVHANKKKFRTVGESLDGIKNIKLYDAETQVSRDYEVHARRFAASQIRMQVLTESPQFLLQILAFGGIILLCLLIVDPLSLSSGSTISEVVPLLGVFAFAGQRILPELGRLFRSLGQLRFGSAVVDSLYGGMSETPLPVTRRGTIAPRIRLHESIALEGVCFSYPGSHTAGLTDINLHVRAGETIGIAGGSGAGKTTLADILLGLLRQNTGEIRIDGTSLSHEDRVRWRQSVSYVPQNIFLLDADITSNIAYGMPRDEIDIARVRQVARDAQLDSFITQELKDGYDTQLGERGVRLSGGQQQRIGIARALYRDADVIVLDEATSALDTLTERSVMEAIEGLHGHKTIFVIAHRMSTLTGCDRVVLLEKGRVAGQGSWEEMARESEIFRAMLSSDNCG